MALPNFAIERKGDSDGTPDLLIHTAAATGSGGAIYNNDNTFQLQVCDSEINNNTAKEGGGAIFFVSNDRSGTLSITNSVLSANSSAKFETAGLPGIFYLGSVRQHAADAVR